MQGPSDCGSEGDDGASSCGDAIVDLGDVVVERAARAAAVVENLDRPAREKRGIAWGPFSIAQVYSNGAHIGWGATCGQHVDETSGTLQCKKQLSMGTGRKMSSADAQSRIKLWLLEGCSIPYNLKKGSPVGSRSQHVRIDARTLPVLSDQELERRLAAFQGGASSSGLPR